MAASKVKTHFTWSVERNDGKCPSCRRVTILVCAPLTWSVPEDQEATNRTAVPLPDYVEVNEEVTGHWCRACNRLVSLSLNT